MFMCLTLCAFGIFGILAGLLAWSVYRMLRTLWRIIIGALSLLRTLALGLGSGLASLRRRAAPRRVVREVPTYRTQAAKAAARAVLR